MKKLLDLLNSNFRINLLFNARGFKLGHFVFFMLFSFLALVIAHDLNIFWEKRNSPVPSCKGPNNPDNDKKANLNLRPQLLN